MMKNRIMHIVSWLVVGVLLCVWSAGCKKVDGHSEHEGHGHEEAAAHVAVVDGVEMCGEHNVPEAECGICKPQLIGQLNPGGSMKVRLPSEASAGIVGVQTASPQTGAMADVVECFAEVSFNQSRLAQIVAPVGGIVQSVDVDLGSKVEQGQTVGKLWSAEIAEAVSKAVLTHQNLERERKLADRVTARASLQEAEAVHNASCLPLRMLGFTEEQIDELGRAPQDQILLQVRAPFAGEIVERTAVSGSLVETGKTLFTVVDRATMWAMLQIPENVLTRVQSGQTVELRVDSLPGEVFTGKLAWIGPAVDERTRMVRARAEFADPDNLLKDKMFAMARIVTKQVENTLLVPTSCVQYVEGRPLVFVKLAEDLYDARAVQLGAKSNGLQQVLAGLGTEEPVATTHTFALKSALLMSRLGAGCADD